MVSFSKNKHHKTLERKVSGQPKHVRVLPGVYDQEKERDNRDNTLDTLDPLDPIKKAAQGQLTTPLSEAREISLSQTETVNTLHLVDALPHKSRRDQLRKIGEKIINFIDSFKPMNN